MRDAALALLITIMIPTAGWTWSLAGRLSTLETTQHFILEQNQDRQQMADLIQKIDKRLTILETLVLQNREEPKLIDR
ncbi:TPA: hypothetical protein ACX6Q6_003560 [Photobacterium damselae]